MSRWSMRTGIPWPQALLVAKALCENRLCQLDVEWVPVEAGVHIELVEHADQLADASTNVLREELDDLDGKRRHEPRRAALENAPPRFVVRLVELAADADFDVFFLFTMLEIDRHGLLLSRVQSTTEMHKPLPVYPGNHLFQYLNTYGVVFY